MKCLDHRLPSARFLVLICFPLILMMGKRSTAVEFNFIVEPGTSQQAIDGFVAAGDLWSDVLSDDITVNITIAFGDIPSTTGATILGATGSSIFIPPPDTTVVPDFLKLKEALENDARSVNDLVSTANLPTETNSLTAYTNLRDGSIILDSDGSGNNTFFRINTANAKALGLLDPDDPGEDASISFNSSVSFDFDPSNGIAPGSTDFIGVAAHEIGHALGFASGVDLVDVFTGNGPSATVDLNGAAIPGNGSLEPFALFTALDLFRRSDVSITAGPDVFDLSTNPGAFLSINGEPSDLLMETGSFNGSGQQASHFLDNAGLGILDPTVAVGELLEITNNDLLGLDVIGFDVIPFGESNGFHNNLMPVDVNADGAITPIDALSIINDLNDRELSEPTGAILLDNANAVFLDVNNDQFVSPIDALLVINQLTSNAATLAAASNTAVVPEPGLTPVLWLVSLAILRLRRRSHVG